MARVLIIEDNPANMTLAVATRAIPVIALTALAMKGHEWSVFVCKNAQASQVSLG